MRGINTRYIHETMNNFIDKLQRALSKIPILVKFLVKFRNQVNKVIGYHICYDHLASVNGEELLVKISIQKGLRTIVDVGANKGDWAAMFLASSSWKGKIFLIEPGGYAYRELLTRFHNDERAIAYNIGFSDHSGYATFYEEQFGGEKSSFVKVQTVQSEELKDVKVLTIDDFALQNCFTEIDMLKIDCEGLDFNVIKGASGLLESGRIKIVQFEYSRDWIESGNTLKACFHFLEKNGYQLYHLSGKGLAAFPLDYYGEFFSYSNFVAVNKNYTQLISGLIKQL